MSYLHAVVWTDHHHAEVTRFDAETAQTQKVKAHQHPTGQHGSGVRAEHEFLAQVCRAIEATPEVLVTGAHTALADFRHYVEKHSPQTARHIVGYEVVGAQTELQRLAAARKYFVDRATLAPQG